MAIGFEQFLDILFEITSGADNIKDIHDTRECSKQFVCAYLSDCCSIHERIKSVVWQCYANHKTAIPSSAVIYKNSKTSPGALFYGKRGRSYCLRR